MKSWRVFFRNGDSLLIYGINNSVNHSTRIPTSENNITVGDRDGSVFTINKSDIMYIKEFKEYWVK